MGVKLRDVLTACGGPLPGRTLKGVIPGGTSMPPLMPKDLDISLDFDSVRAAGTFLGAGGMIILDDTVDAVEVAHNIERFLAHESCGQCTPCREGSNWSERILERVLEGHGAQADVDNLSRVGDNITGKVICALGDTVGMVLKGYIGRYPEDFKKRVTHG
jgi:NADH-quinone oxidoreductase subunit F